MYSSTSLLHDSAPTRIYTLSLHDALPICHGAAFQSGPRRPVAMPRNGAAADRLAAISRADAVEQVGRGQVVGERLNFRSEEHTSELQSLRQLVCRLLLEKKKVCLVHPTVH